MAKKPSLADKIRKTKQETKSTLPPHLIVKARAGTGKTTTLVEGLRCFGTTKSKLTPSPQQRAVWDAIALSKGTAHSICFVAFNKAIATELQARVPPEVQAMTMHSLGYKAVTRAYGRVSPQEYRVQDIISELLERDIRELRRYKPELVKATQDLVGLCKQNLTEPTPEALEELASYYDVDCNSSRSEIYDLVPRVLERCKDVNRDGCIDFNDMIWLPVVQDLAVYRHDLLLVDECQDQSKCQQQLALKAGSRLIAVGDPQQAIYGFAGADSESMPRMAAILGASDQGCIELPLTVTRRCGKAIVKEAQKLVPDFEAFETNPEGMVRTTDFKLYVNDVQDGDMVICRCNAPLVSQCFRFLRMDRKANIAGRDIGVGLIKTINKLKAGSIHDLITKLDDWYYAEAKKEQAKKNPSDARMINLADKRECLLAFCEDAQYVQDVIDRIEKIFSDTSTGGIRLSSIHKAKGLEAPRVFFLMPKEAPTPHMMAKTKQAKEQELNLLYVGQTRAIEELVYVK